MGKILGIFSSFQKYLFEFVRRKLQKLEFVNFDEISSHLFHFFSIFTKLKKYF